MFFSTMDSYLGSNHLSCEKNWTPMPSNSGSYGRQAGRWNMARLQNLENPLKVKLYCFYFVYSSAMLLIVLKEYFSLRFSLYFRVCFVVCKIRSPFFSCRSLLLGTSLPNNIASGTTYVGLSRYLFLHYSTG